MPKQNTFTKRSTKILTYFLLIQLIILSITASNQASNSANFDEVTTSLDIITVPTDYPSIQEAITHAAQGTTIIVLPGVYRESLSISKKIILQGSGADNTYITCPNSERITIKINTPQVTVSDFSITNGEIAAIWIEEADNTTITNNMFYNNSHGIRLFYSHQTSITHNTFINCSIGFFGNQKKHFYHNLHDNIINNHPLLYLKDTSNLTVNAAIETIQSVIVVNCTDLSIINYQNHLPFEMGIQVSYSKDIFITNTNITKKYFGIYLRNSSNIYINNSFIGSNEVGIHIRESTADIYQNKITCNTYGIECWQANQNMIQSNTITSNTNTGIFIWHNSNNNTICNNNSISKNVNGVDIYESSNNKISENYIISNTYSGLYLKEAVNTTIKRNQISKNTLRGISIKTSTQSSIQGNIVFDNKYYGILFDSARYNSISNNTILTNEHGICFFQQCDNNQIINNTIERNEGDGLQILSESNANIIKENDIKFNFLNGIIVSKSNNNNITNCVISLHELSGIHITQASKTLIQKNDIKNNWRGIQLKATRSSNILNNNIQENYWGIKLANSYNNHIKNNVLKKNNIGIMRGIFNKITTNNFIDNEPFDALGQLHHTNVWLRNYFNSHPSILPHYLYGFNIDILPHVEPYHYT